MILRGRCMPHTFALHLMIARLIRAPLCHMITEFHTYLLFLHTMTSGEKSTSYLTLSGGIDSIMCHFQRQAGIKIKMNSRNLLLPALILFLLNSFPSNIPCLLFRTLFGSWSRILQKPFLIFNLIVFFIILFFCKVDRRFAY